MRNFATLVSTPHARWASASRWSGDLSRCEPIVSFHDDSEVLTADQELSEVGRYTRKTPPKPKRLGTRAAATCLRAWGLIPTLHRLESLLADSHAR